MRIEKYHLFLAIHHNLNAYHSLFQGLSMQLFTELKAHIYDRLFRDAPFFQNAPQDFISSIVLALEETTFSPGEAVIVQGEMGNEMFWILRGRCDVIDSSGTRVVATLCENNFFGEVALLVQVPRLCTVRAATYSLLAQITRERFLPIIDEFPEQKKYFVERIRSYQISSLGSEGQNLEDTVDPNSDHRQSLRSRRTEDGDRASTLLQGELPGIGPAKRARTTRRGSFADGIAIGRSGEGTEDMVPPVNLASSAGLRRWSRGSLKAAAPKTQLDEEIENEASLLQGLHQGNTRRKTLNPIQETMKHLAELRGPSSYADSGTAGVSNLLQQPKQTNSLSMRRSVTKIILGNRLRKSFAASGEQAQDERTATSFSSDHPTASPPPGSAPDPSLDAAFRDSMTLRRVSSSSNCGFSFPNLTRVASNPAETRLVRNLLEPLKALIQDEVGSLRELVEDLGMQQELLNVHVKSLRANDGG
jgi:CRP-like cAMP-binding protein